MYNDTPYLPETIFCEHASFAHGVDPITKMPRVKVWTCKKPNTCKGCAHEKGKDYRKFIANALSDGDILSVAIVTDAQHESHRRKWGASEFRAWPIGDNTSLIISRKALPDSCPINEAWINAFNWAELARAKWQWVEDSGQPHKVSGKLGYRKEDHEDGKEPFEDKAVSFEKEAEQEGKNVVAEVCNDLWKEVGEAKSVDEAEQHVKRFIDLLKVALDNAGIKPTRYTIVSCWSRAVFAIKSTNAICSENNILEDDVLEIIERYRQKQALAD